MVVQCTLFSGRHHLTSECRIAAVLSEASAVSPLSLYGNRLAAWQCASLALIVNFLDILSTHVFAEEKKARRVVSVDYSKQTDSPTAARDESHFMVETTITSEGARLKGKVEHVQQAEEVFSLTRQVSRCRDALYESSEWFATEGRWTYSRNNKGSDHGIDRGYHDINSRGVEEEPQNSGLNREISIMRPVPVRPPSPAPPNNTASAAERSAPISVVPSPAATSPHHLHPSSSFSTSSSPRSPYDATSSRDDTSSRSSINSVLSRSAVWSSSGERMNQGHGTVSWKLRYEQADNRQKVMEESWNLMLFGRIDSAMSCLLGLTCGEETRPSRNPRAQDRNNNKKHNVGKRQLPLGLFVFRVSPGVGAVHSSDPSGHIHLQFWSTNPPLIHLMDFGQCAEIYLKIL